MAELMLRSSYHSRFVLATSLSAFALLLAATGTAPPPWMSTQQMARRGWQRALRRQRSCSEPYSSEALGCTCLLLQPEDAAAWKLQTKQSTANRHNMPQAITQHLNPLSHHVRPYPSRCVRSLSATILSATHMHILLQAF